MGEPLILADVIRHLAPVCAVNLIATVASAFVLALAVVRDGKEGHHFRAVDISMLVIAVAVVTSSIHIDSVILWLAWRLV